LLRTTPTTAVQLPGKSCEKATGSTIFSSVWASFKFTEASSVDTVQWLLVAVAAGLGTVIGFSGDALAGGIVDYLKRDRFILLRSCLDVAEAPHKA
jgi:hypothetical protein